MRVRLGLQRVAHPGPVIVEHSVNLLFPLIPLALAPLSGGSVRVGRVWLGAGIYPETGRPQGFSEQGDGGKRDWCLRLGNWYWACAEACETIRRKAAAAATSAEKPRTKRVFTAESSLPARTQGPSATLTARTKGHSFPAEAMVSGRRT